VLVLSVPEVEGLITFLYYDDLEEAARFYEDVMGFEKTVDQGWAKIYRVAGEAHVGLVDGSRGYHRPSPSKPVMITVVVDDVDAWFRYLKGKGVKTLSEPRDHDEIGIRAFLLEDPEGYVIEIQKFY
jgi:lactoylglutathione lyase